MLWGNKRLALQLAMGAATVAMTAGAASAAVISGEANGLTWTAQSTIIGMGPTGQGTVNINGVRNPDEFRQSRSQVTASMARALARSGRHR